MIQYRGEILQLIRLSEVLPERRVERRSPEAAAEVSEDAMQVVVCTVGGRRIGIVVHRILDIIDQRIDVTRPRSRAGVRACIVLRDRVTELIDVEEVVRMADPEFFERTSQEPLVVSS
jgi:two-component system chemotaxis sensor kinase CheA